MEAKVASRNGLIALWAVAIILLAATAYRWWLVADYNAAWLPIPGLRRRVTVWACAALVGAIYVQVTRERASRGFALLLMTVPIWGAVWSFINSIPILSDSNSTLVPLTQRELSNQYIYGLMYDIGYVGVGFMLWIGKIPTSYQALAARMVDAGVPRRHEGKSMLAGYLLFPAIFLGSIGLSWLFSRSKTLSNGNEASIWDNMTPYHDIMISATAAVTEELVYRVVGIALIAGLLSRLGVSRAVAIGGGVTVQALIFAGAHGGYGTWSHVLLPLAFGFVAAGIYLIWGLWAAVMVHFLIDVYAFAGYTWESSPWFVTILTLGLLANVVASGVYAIWKVVVMITAKPTDT